MQQRSVHHATFTIDRYFDAAPSRVFQAWADPAMKARWFRGPEEWGPDESTYDFRVGGFETSVGGPPGGPTHAFEARYYDIVPDERIVFAYDMLLNGVRISVSLSSAEFRAEGSGTRMLYTEHGAYLDGYDDSGAREEGTREIFDQLERELAG